MTLFTLFISPALRADEAANQATPSPAVNPGINLRVEPAEVRPDGFLTITANAPLTVEGNAITVGGVSATLQPFTAMPATVFQVKLSPETPIGLQPVVIAAKEGPRFGSVTVAAVIDSLKPTPESGNGVLTGGSITLQTLGSLPQGVTSLNVRMTPQPAEPSSSPSPTPIELIPSLVKGNQITVSIPDYVPEGRYRVELASPNNQSKFNIAGSAIVTVHALWPCFWIAVAPIGLVGLTILGLCLLQTPKKRSPSGRRYRWFDVLFLEEENNTYSLSRAQFVAWLATIATAYVFLFITRGLIDNTWEFPPLAGFAYTFLLSLGTLVAAQGANSIRGFKGAGSIDPKIADLVLNGDVLALERVQQLVWTIISIGIFLWITFRGYASSNVLPTVPQEMLALMGISSAGYLTGKFVRKPGPIIQQITSETGDSIKISGTNLSRDAFVWIDGAQQPKGAVSASEAEPNNPIEFARSLLVKLPVTGQVNPGAATDLWRSKSHTVAVVNVDGQRAEWAIQAPLITEVTSTQSDSNFTLSITGSGIVPGALAESWNSLSNRFVTITDFKPVGAVDPTIASKWSGTTTFKPVRIRITNPDQQYGEGTL